VNELPRNVIILCTDEYRGDMLSANGRNPDIQTPRMDALAARGVNFSQHYTPFPKCVPARISLMTGRYCHTDGYRNIFQHLPYGIPDLASHLKGKGYELVELGRNHCWENMLQASDSPPSLEAGQKGIVFDHTAWKAGPLKDVWEKRMAKRRNCDVTAGAPETLAEGKGFVWRNDSIGWLEDEAIAAQTIEYLTRVRDRSRPFFLWANLGKPHPQYYVDDPWFSMYDRRKMQPFPYGLPRNPPISLRRQREVRTGTDAPEGLFRAMQSTYMGMCSKVDMLMGRMIDCIEDEGLFEDSIVLLISDHGDFAGQYGLPEKWDTTFTDCLVHVPCAMVAPNLPAGRTARTLTDHTDVPPTICSLLGIEPFAGIHGTSMIPAADGQRTRQAVFADGGHEAEMRSRFNIYEHWKKPAPKADPATGLVNTGGGKQETYRLYPEAMARAKMVRAEGWKLVHRETGDHELYDLNADPWEMDNIYEEPGTEEARLELYRLLMDWTLRTDPDRPYQEKVGA